MNPIETIVSTTQAIAANPNDIDAYMQRAKVLIAMQQLDDAMSDLNAIVSIASSTTSATLAEALFTRGSISMSRGDKTSALDDFKRAFTINPELMKRIEGHFERK